jgi:hypothetical protein
LWPDGRRYSGQWSNGQRHGVGTYTNARGEKRRGSWSQDRPVSWEDVVLEVVEAHPREEAAPQKQEACEKLPLEDAVRPRQLLALGESPPRGTIGGA